VTGRGNSESFCSSSHGAGRRWSRTEARRRVSTERLSNELNGVYFDHRLARRLCDEAPSAYKDIEKVMRAQRDLVCISRKVWPVLSYKGG
jgi:tRNA-splicing ligase RtcB